MDRNQNAKHVPLAITDNLSSGPNSSPEDSSTAVSASAKLDLNNQLNPTVKLDELGPMVVNSDGTLSRIANWNSMTEPERQRTLRVLSARNRLRLANEQKKQLGQEGEVAEAQVRIQESDAGSAPAALKLTSSASEPASDQLQLPEPKAPRSILGEAPGTGVTTSGSSEPATGTVYHDRS